MNNQEETIYIICTSCKCKKLILEEFDYKLNGEIRKTCNKCILKKKNKYEPVKEKKKRGPKSKPLKEIPIE